MVRDEGQRVGRRSWKLGRGKQQKKIPIHSRKSSIRKHIIYLLSLVHVQSCTDVVNKGTQLICPLTQAEVSTDRGAYNLHHASLHLEVIT